MRDLRRRSEGPFLRLWFSDTCFSLVSPEKCSQTKKLKDLLACSDQLERVGIPYFL